MKHETTTSNPQLYPKLKRAPDKRMINKHYQYMPSLITKIDGVPTEAIVELITLPEDKDVLCTVEYRHVYYKVFWKDLVKL